MLINPILKELRYLLGLEIFYMTQFVHMLLSLCECFKVLRILGLTIELRSYILVWLVIYSIKQEGLLLSFQNDSLCPSLTHGTLGPVSQHNFVTFPWRLIVSMAAFNISLFTVSLRSPRPKLFRSQNAAQSTKERKRFEKIQVQMPAETYRPWRS